MLKRTDKKLRLLSDYLREAAEAAPHRELIVGEGYRITYGEAWEKVTHLAKFFLTTGVRRGDAIAYLFPPGPEFLYTYMAGARIGALLVGLNPRYTRPELEYILDNSRPRVLALAGSPGGVDWQKVGAELAGRCPGLETLLVCGEEAAVPGAVGLDEALKKGAGTEDAPLREAEAAVSTDDGVLVVYTSGTTGRPKGAVLTHRNIISNILAETRQWDIGPRDRIMFHLPVNHVGGATELSFAAIMGKATLVALPSFHPVKTLEMVARERVTVLGQVPTMFALEFSLPNFGEFDLSSVRLVVVSGAPPTREVIEGMFRICADVRTGYGMTEVAGFATYTAPGDDVETVFSTVGKIAPEFELKIVDANRRELPSGEVGEIALRGEFVMKEYLRLPEETAQAVDREGWFYTGDLGVLDGRGYLRLVGRLKEMYITGGYNVYPAEIEDALTRHPAVLMAACLGVPDPVLGEVGRAYVVCRPGMTVGEAELKAFLSERLADYKIPKQYVFREALPLTPLGKIDKKALAGEIRAETR